MLHEAQVNQLKIWPRLAFPHSTLATQTEANCEEYHIAVKVVSEEKHNKIKTRATMLAKNIRWMLGNRWTIEIYENGKLLVKKAGEKPQKFKGVSFEAGMIVPKTPWKFQSQQSPK